MQRTSLSSGSGELRVGRNGRSVVAAKDSEHDVGRYVKEKLILKQRGSSSSCVCQCTVEKSPATFHSQFRPLWKVAPNSELAVWYALCLRPPSLTSVTWPLTSLRQNYIYNMESPAVKKVSPFEAVKIDFLPFQPICISCTTTCPIA